MRFAQMQRQIGKAAALLQVEPFGQMHHPALGQAALTRFLQQQCGLQNAGGHEALAAPVGIHFTPGQCGVGWQASALGGKLSVERGLVLGPAPVGSAGVGGLTKGLIGAAFPIARAPHGNGRSHSWCKPLEMAEGSLGIVQFAKGDEARQPFQFRKVAVFVRRWQLVACCNPVGEAIIVVAHEITGQISAAVGPIFRATEGLKRAGAFLHQLNR